MSDTVVTIPTAHCHRLPRLPEWTLVASVTLLIGLAFLTGAHRWDRSSLKNYVESAEERADAAESGNKLRRIAFLAIGGAGLGLLSIGRKLPVLREPMGLLMVLAFAWTFTSLAWADTFGFTLKRLLLLLLCIGGVMGVASALTLRQLTILALTVSASYLILGVAAEVLQGNFKPWSSGYRFAGTLHPNTQSTNCGTVALAALALWKDGRNRGKSASRRRRLRLNVNHMLALLFLSGLAFLLLTKSRTATAAILLVIGIIWATRRKVGVNLIIAGTGLLAALTLSYTLTLTGTGESVGEAANLGRDDSQGAFNGRLPIWEICFRRLGNRLPVGVGYGGFWTAKRIEDVSWELGWSISSVHSEYIELTLGLGMIGLFLYLLVQTGAIAWFWLRYYRLGLGSDAMFLGLLLVGSIQGFMETGYLHPDTLTPFVTLAGMTRLAFFTGRAELLQGAI